MEEILNIGEMAACVPGVPVPVDGVAKLKEGAASILAPKVPAAAATVDVLTAVLLTR
jgi:hypothetical protein